MALYEVCSKESICNNCGELAFNKIKTREGFKEYTLSGFCEECFDGRLGKHYQNEVGNDECKKENSVKFFST